MFLLKPEIPKMVGTHGPPISIIYSGRRIGFTNAIKSITLVRDTKLDT
jgi:hypothetical protein